MEKRGRRTVNLFIAVIVALLGVAYAFFVYQAVPDLAVTESRSDMILVSNDRSDAGDNPFILEAKIISETPHDLVIDVKYFLSDEIDGEYNISIHPDNGEWSYSMNTMRTGINHEIITVSYRPDSAFKTGSQSRLLHLYISKYADGKYIDKVFDRTISFPKTWTK